MVIEEVKAPPDAVPCFEEVGSSQMTMFEEEVHVESADPKDAAMKKEKETDQSGSQRPNEQQEYLNTLCGRKILQLKGNAIPRGLVPLERLFDQNDVTKEPNLAPDGDEVEEVNIGMVTRPKIIRLSKELPPET